MSSKNIDFFSYGNTIDGTNSCSGVETLAENLIEDNEADSVIVYPSSNGWARLRSESYRMTSDNSAAVLPLPLYKVNRVLLKPRQETFTVYVGGEQTTVSVYDLVSKSGEKFSNIDITPLVLREEEWNALTIAQTTEEYRKNICKDNTFYWKKGSTSIPFLGTVYEKGVIFKDNSPTYARLIEYIQNIMLEREYTFTTASGTTGYFDAFIDEMLPSKSDVREWQYRIEYVPITSAFKMRSRKSAETKEDYLQPFNQRAEVNSANAFGKNMYLTAQKTGVRGITVVKNYTRLADIPPLGALVNHNGKKYRLIGNKRKFTNTIFVQVTHTLSEDWTAKSKHVAVDQKYRNWNIPQDMIWRNLYWEDYLCISKEPIDTSHNKDTPGISIDDFMQALKVSKTNDKTVDTFVWDNIVLPCTTMGIGNSLVFSASMKDQLSAGLREIEPNLCEEVRYCNSDGTLDRARIKLATGVGSGLYLNGNFIEKTIDDEFDLLGKQKYPATEYGTYNGSSCVWNMPINAVFNKSFLINKTAGEAIKFTYQIHLTPYDSDIVVGNAFAELNPLIKKWESDRKFKVWLMKDYLREGEDLIISGNNTAYTQTYDGQYFTLTSNGGYYTLRLNISVDFQSSGYVGWCITDENNKLYLGCNSATTLLYFTMQHKRK